MCVCACVCIPVTTQPPPPTHTNVSPPTTHEHKAFFLNLYHTGVLLARLVLGAPPANSALRWCGYYTSAAVEALGEIFSLAEVGLMDGCWRGAMDGWMDARPWGWLPSAVCAGGVVCPPRHQRVLNARSHTHVPSIHPPQIEHNILRSPSPRAKGALLRLLLPSTRYPRPLKPRTPDYRLNFALNCGSLSCPAAVPVYDPEAVDEQLNLVTRWVLDSTVRVEERGRAVVLPKVRG